MFVTSLVAVVGAAAILYPGMAARADQYPDDLVAQTVVTQPITEGGGENYPGFAGGVGGDRPAEYSAETPAADGGAQHFLRTDFSHYGG